MRQADTGKGMDMQPSDTRMANLPYLIVLTTASNIFNYLKFSLYHNHSTTHNLSLLLLGRVRGESQVRLPISPRPTTDKLANSRKQS